MNLKGLKINFIGDSITEGALATTDENKYVNIIANEYGAECRNYSKCGTRIAAQKNPTSTEDKDYYCARIERLSPDADVIVVFGGTNDYGHGNADMGRFSDRAPDTFYGACHYLYYNLLTKFPLAKIVVITPMHRVGEDNPRGEGGNKEKEMYPLKAYVGAIREVAEYYSLPVLDLYASSGLQPEVPEINKAYFSDGLHPNDLGHRLLADKIAHFIENLI